LYGVASRIYHDRYDRAPSRSYRAPVSVISIGNLAVGGTGKTPFVIALIHLLSEIAPELSESDRIAVLSRGYGRKSKKLVEVKPDSVWEDAGDEPILIKRKAPQVAVVVHPDRRLSAAYAINRLKSRILLLDDGFQHRAMARDLDIVLLPRDNPLGNGRQLPAGPLRESPQSLSRASWLIGVQSGIPPFTGGQKGGESKASQVAAQFGKPYFEATPHTSLPQDATSFRSVFLLTSIANPSRFTGETERLNLKVCGKAIFPDHHPFSQTDLDRVNREAERYGAEAVVTTEKDLIRIREWRYPIPLCAFQYSLEISDKQSLIQELEPVLGRMRQE
jgi:tetraacyldisaccharide 4'-kinase